MFELITHDVEILKFIHTAKELNLVKFEVAVCHGPSHTMGRDFARRCVCVFRDYDSCLKSRYNK